MHRLAPHVIPYQGSKRRLAEKILTYIPCNTKCLYEPFAGSAAVTLAAAANGIADMYFISDKLEPLVRLWEMVINEPDKLIKEYSALWNSQLDNPSMYYTNIRDVYNKTKNPVILLYLVARCVKNAIRFNSSGDFNQGPDNRRLGMRPEKLEREVGQASLLLRGRSSVRCKDFRVAVADATEQDVVYMDPPWQGTSGTRDPRYAYLLDLEELIEELDSMNRRKIPYILSFDGACGDRNYGKELPSTLRLKKIHLKAGRSTQATLLGRDEETVESLYLSRHLMERIESTNLPTDALRKIGQNTVFQQMSLLEMM